MVYERLLRYVDKSCKATTLILGRSKLQLLGILGGVTRTQVARILTEKAIKKHRKIINKTLLDLEYPDCKEKSTYIKQASNYCRF